MSKTNKFAPQGPALNVMDRPVNRPGQPKPLGLYLVELRSRHAATQSPVPRRKLVITIEKGESSDGLPKPIKITVA